jgi:heme exporter protein D
MEIIFTISLLAIIGLLVAILIYVRRVFLELERKKMGEEREQLEQEMWNDHLKNS